uniref:Uncharacterized protein n=1 Tax=Anguilla anguilla TaxID=7936 RepID=A0A0E9SSM0_ANGAN
MPLSRFGLLWIGPPNRRLSWHVHHPPILSNRPPFPLELGDQQADVETLKGMLFLNTRPACLIR